MKSLYFNVVENDSAKVHAFILSTCFAFTDLKSQFCWDLVVLLMFALRTSGD